MSTRLAGRTALVTGSTSNIGRAIAIRFAAEGARVVVTGRDATRGDAVVEQISAAGGTAPFVEADLDGSVERSRSLAERASASFGAIEILVNNAGVYPPGGTLAIDGDTFDRIYPVNVKAPYFLTAALVPPMMEAGGGVVINLGSWGARLGLPGGTAYAATKGAMETLTRAWAAEFGARGVRVNAVSPGVTFDGSNPVARCRRPDDGSHASRPARAPGRGGPGGGVSGQRRRPGRPRHGPRRRRRSILGAVVRRADPMTGLTAKGAATRQRIIEGAAQVIRQNVGDRVRRRWTRSGHATVDEQEPAVPLLPRRPATTAAGRRPLRGRPGACRPAAPLVLPGDVGGLAALAYRARPALPQAGPDVPAGHA